MNIKLELTTKKILDLTEVEYEELKKYFNKDDVVINYFPQYPNYPTVAPYIYPTQPWEPTVTYTTTK